MFAHVGLPTFSTTVDPTRTHIQCCSLWGRFLISRKRGKNRSESGFSISVVSVRTFEMAWLHWETQLRLLCSQFCANIFAAAVCSWRMFCLILSIFVRAVSARARAVEGPEAGFNSCHLVGVVVSDVLGAIRFRSGAHSCGLEDQGVMEWGRVLWVWVLFIGWDAWITLSRRVHRVAGAEPVLVFDAGKPAVVVIFLLFFFPRFLFPLCVRFIFLRGLVAVGEPGHRGRMLPIGVGGGLC